MNRLKAKRLWAVVIAVLMLIQLLQTVATADTSEDTGMTPAHAEDAGATPSVDPVDPEKAIDFSIFQDSNKTMLPMVPLAPKTPIAFGDLIESELPAASEEPAEQLLNTNEPNGDSENAAVDCDTAIDLSACEETDLAAADSTDDSEDAASVDAGGEGKDAAGADADNGSETVPFDVTVTITGHRETIVYDGLTHIIAGYDVSISDPRYTEADFNFIGAAAAEGIGALDFPMGLTADQFINTNPNANVTFQVTDGMLTITRRPVTVKSASASKTYDGTPLEEREFTILGDGFAEGEMPIILVLGSIKDVGTVTNTIKISFWNAPKGSLINTINPDNYEITVDEGTLEVLPKAVTVTADNQIKEYGEEDPELTANVEGLLNGDTVGYTIVREEGENSGYYSILPGGETLQGNYAVAFVPGTLRIKMPPKSKDRFTLAWFSDARITASGARADALEAMVDWTVEHAEEKNIVGLFGTGSLVGTFNDAETEAKSNEILSKIRTVRSRDLRYYGAVGAIDVNGDETDYGPCAERSVRGASIKYHDGEIWIQQLFTPGIMAVGIGHHKLAETEEELNLQKRWIDYVNERIAALNGNYYSTILFVNDYVDETGKLTPFGELIETEIIAENPSIRIVLSSCASGAIHTEMTYGDRTVNVLAFNYSEDEANGLGYMRLLTFDPETRSVEVSTYSPVCGKTVYDEAAPENDTFTFANAY